MLIGTLTPRLPRWDIYLSLLNSYMSAVYLTLGSSNAPTSAMLFWVPFCYQRNRVIRAMPISLGCAVMTSTLVHWECPRLSVKILSTQFPELGWNRRRPLAANRPKRGLNEAYAPLLSEPWIFRCGRPAWISRNILSLALVKYFHGLQLLFAYPCLTKVRALFGVMEKTGYRISPASTNDSRSFTA